VKAFWKYTLARLGLFVLTYYVLWTVAASRWEIAPLDPFVLLAAIVVSGGVSLFVLRGLREDVAEHLATRADARAKRVEPDSDLD
jgi:hypothetical protein